MRREVLLIEDCPESQQSLHETLHEHGYHVSTISDADQALATVDTWAGQFELVIIEEAMHGRRGLELLREAHSKRQDLPVLVVTRDGDWNGYARAISDGALDYLPHPVDRRKLLAAVEDALARAV